MATRVVNSAFDDAALTVSDMVKDPTWIPQQIAEALDGSFIEDLVFRNGGANDGVVAFREMASPFLSSDAENVAEFAEIPVADPMLGDVKSIVGKKVALAIRVSREMQRFNKIDQVQLRMQALVRTMVKNSVAASIKALDSADIATAAAGKAWGQADADPMKDVFDGIEAIQGAKATTVDNAYFGYEPDLILAHPTVITKLIRNEKVQKLFIGDVAHDNPLYKGLKNIQIAGLDVATTRFMPADSLYILERGTAGFVSDADPLTITDLYEEGGNSGQGGPRQTWRADAFQNRIVGVDNPKAIFKLTGING